MLCQSREVKRLILILLVATDDVQQKHRNFQADVQCHFSVNRKMRGRAHASKNRNRIKKMLDAIKAAWADFRCIFERDPAARNYLEVLLCYPGLQCLLVHRFAHQLFKWGVPLVPRLLSHLNRFLTGIDIHPGATIGKGVFIDHGMGVVIGETAIVGDRCLIYQVLAVGTGTAAAHGKIMDCCRA